MVAQSSFTFFVYYHGFNTLLPCLFSMYFCFRAIMERNLAMRRRLQLPRLVIPPIGRWSYLVKCLKPTVAVPELEISSSERKRTCEDIFQPCSNYDAYASECAFCVLYGVWPRCGLQQPKRQRQSPMLAGNSDWHPMRTRIIEEACNNKFWDYRTGHHRRINDFKNLFLWRCRPNVPRRSAVSLIALWSVLF